MIDFQRNDRFRPTCASCRKQPVPENGAGLYGGNAACGKGETPSPFSPVNTVQNPTSLAMLYSPKQPWQNLYEPARALSRGTLFADLDKPFNPNCR